MLCPVLLQVDVSTPTSRKSQQGSQGQCQMHGPFSRGRCGDRQHSLSRATLTCAVSSVLATTPCAECYYCGSHFADGEILVQKVEVIFSSFPRLGSQWSASRASTLSGCLRGTCRPWDSQVRPPRPRPGGIMLSAPETGVCWGASSSAWVSGVRPSLSESCAPVASDCPASRPSTYSCVVSLLISAQ